jgi:hypothetical protein
VGCLHSMSATAELAGAFARGRSNRFGFTAEQKRAARDRYWEGYNDPDEITISDEAIKRAMRVYTAEEAMDLLTCGAPGRSASTECWQEFLTKMRGAPQTRATQRGISEAEWELMWRSQNTDAYAKIVEMQQRLLRALIPGTTETEADATPGRLRHSEVGILDDRDPFGPDRGDDAFDRDSAVNGNTNK